jgi:hypothetical protein
MANELQEWRDAYAVEVAEKLQGSRPDNFLFVIRHAFDLVALRQRQSSDTPLRGRPPAVDWSAVEFDAVDAVVGKRLGLSKYTVAAARLRMGVPAFAKRQPIERDGQ